MENVDVFCTRKQTKNFFFTIIAVLHALIRGQYNSMNLEML